MILISRLNLLINNNNIDDMKSVCADSAVQTLSDICKLILELFVLIRLDLEGAFLRLVCVFES